MNYNQGRDRTMLTPECLLRARTLGEVIKIYEELMLQTVDYHRAGFDGFKTFHELAFDQEFNKPGSQNIDSVLANTKAGVETAVRPVVGQVDNILSTVAVAIPTRLEPSALQKLQRTKLLASIYGINSRQVNQALVELPDDMRKVIKFGLDSYVYREMKTIVSVYGVSSTKVEQIINLASSELVRNAMLASLDDSVFKHIQLLISSYGISSHRVMSGLDCASTPNIKDAMRLALDSDVLVLAKTYAHSYGFNSSYVNEILNLASSPTVRAVLARQFEIHHDSRRGSGSNPFIKDFLSGAEWKTKKNATGSSRTNSQQGQEQPQQPKKEAPQQTANSDTTVDIEKIIEQTVSRYRQYSWLRGESREDIQRIINTVKLLRANASASGTPLDDRKIYLKYRAKAETNPKLVKAVKILEAFMGGNLNGKLPF